MFKEGLAQARCKVQATFWRLRRGLVCGSFRICRTHTGMLLLGISPELIQHVTWDDSHTQCTFLHAKVW